MNKFLLALCSALLLISGSANAVIMQPNPSASLTSLWDAIWPGTFGTIQTLTAGIVASTILIWMAWVLQGIYVALIVKGQITLLEATFLFIRLCTLVTFTMMLLNY